MIYPQLSKILIEDTVRSALKEDLGRAGDITTMATISGDMTAGLSVITRQDGIVAGLALAETAFKMLNSAISFEPQLRDGNCVKAGSTIASVAGCARDILSAERVALNFLSHLSGIATLTGHLVERIAHTKAKICSTRKTTPGLRMFETYAVRCGGGSNHRLGLDDAVLIKDNHIAVAGGVAQAIHSARNFVGHMVKIEVEVDALRQLKEVLMDPPDAILLDNMDVTTLKQAVLMVRESAPHVIIEASGGIRLENVAEKAETGVDYLSSGSLTQSAPALDFGLDVTLCN